MFITLHMWGMIRDHVEPFLRPHGCEVGRLDFQCDADCKEFVKDQGWQYVNRGPAYVLADILAWGNSHGKEPRGAVSLDLADRLERQMMRRFR